MALIPFRNPLSFVFWGKKYLELELTRFSGSEQSARNDRPLTLYQVASLEVVVLFSFLVLQDSANSCTWRWGVAQLLGVGGDSRCTIWYGTMMAMAMAVTPWEGKHGNCRRIRSGQGYIQHIPVAHGAVVQVRATTVQGT